MKDFWDKRYSDEAYVYGKSPNLYFSQKLDLLTPGRILLPAEGEGRNAVYAAKKGWEVTCFDQSEEGKKKAELLAAENKVSIHYILGAIEDVTFRHCSFDVVALIYAHFRPEIRNRFHEKISSFLKPGGHLILEAFSKKQFQFQKINPFAGGPKEEAMLYDTRTLILDFPDYNLIELYQQDVELSEGSYHIGPSSVVRFFGQKEL